MNIKIGDTFKSNKGRGKLIARVVDITDGVALMEYAKSMSAKQWKAFRLSLRYLESPVCGWRSTRGGVTGE